MDKLVYLYYPLVLLLLLWGSKWYGRKQWNEEFFSLEQTKVWQGFFAVCILLHHAGQKTCAPWLKMWYIRPGLDFFVPIGYFFVAFFLVCSGYGLYVSWKRKPDYLKGFFRRRVLPLILTFYVVEWMYLAVRLLLGEKMDTVQIIYYATGLQLANHNSWFVLALPIFYLMFWVCFRFLKGEGAAMTGVFTLILGYVLLGCSLNHLDKDMWMCGEWWYNTAIFFPLGLLFGKYKDAIVRGVKQCWLPVMILTALLGVMLYFGAELVQGNLSYYCEWVENPVERLLRRFMCVLSQNGAALMFVIFIVLLGLKVKIGNGVLRFMGAITLEFYLVHGLFVELFGFDFLEVVSSLKYIKNVFLYTLVVAACSLPVTLLVRKALHPRQPLLPKVKGRTGGTAEMDYERYIRRCYELAVSAGKKGYDTFGALLVHNGEILEEAENTADYEKGLFGHAEFNLVHQCANRYPDQVLKESVLFTSCAPCERCLCAIASLGIETVVCGVSYKAFSRLTPSDYVPVDRKGLLRQLGIRLRLVEGVLEDEGMHVFEWWGGEYRPLSELIAEMEEIKAKRKCKE